jgi:hypothetical protein
LAAATFLVAASPLYAHIIVGNRVFPATLTIDDPGVNDELVLPSFSYLQSANPDRTLGPISYGLGWEYDKTITPDFGLSIGSDGYTWQRNPRAEGWSNIETEAKFAFYQDPGHEFIMSAGGRRRSAILEARKTPRFPPIPSRRSRRNTSSAKASAMPRPTGCGLSR